MNKKTITQFLQSFVVFPMLAIGGPLAGVAQIPAATQDTVTLPADSTAITPLEEEIRAAHAKELDTFLASYDSPLEGYGRKFVDEAEKNNLDWRLLVSISGIETTFARPGSMCKNPKAPNNPFGWGSCKIGFKSIDQAIEVVSANLGGNNPNTAHHYDGKTTLQILKKYNSIIPTYTQKIIKIMKMIDKDEEVA